MFTCRRNVKWGIKSRGKSRDGLNMARDKLNRLGTFFYYKTFVPEQVVNASLVRSHSRVHKVFLFILCSRMLAFKCKFVDSRHLMLSFRKTDPVFVYIYNNGSDL